MAETSQQPQGGIAYPLALGSTFDGHDSQEYLTMRIDFIPASADRTAEGSLHLDPETHTAELTVPSKNDDSLLSFQGKYDTLKEGLDCVAVFDPSTQSFRLELLSGQTTLRHMPGARRDKRDINAAAKPQSQPQKVQRTTPPPPPMDKISPTPPLATTPPENGSTGPVSQEIARENKLEKVAKGAKPAPAAGKEQKRAKKTPPPPSTAAAAAARAPERKPVAVKATMAPRISPVPPKIQNASVRDPQPPPSSSAAAAARIQPAAAAVPSTALPVPHAGPSPSPVTTALPPPTQQQTALPPPAAAAAAAVPPPRAAAPAPLTTWKVTKPIEDSGAGDDDMGEIEDDFFHGGLD